MREDFVYFYYNISPLFEKIHYQVLRNNGNIQVFYKNKPIPPEIKPKYVLEIGTFTGYSALCMQRYLPKDGMIHTIEIRPEDGATAAENFSKLNANKQITLHIGDAKEIISQLPYQWDLVFIDADKTGYINYYEMVVPLLAKDGIIIADNVLFHGQVLEEPLKGKNAKAVHAFNQHVQQDPRTEQVMLSIRDGLTIIKKK